MLETIQENVKTTLADIARFTDKVSKKRDEVRKLIDEIAPIIESLESAEEEFSTTIRLLNEARDSMEGAADIMSQYA